jgi:hypothetical protein
MEHVVFYQSAQGAPAFRRVASLEDAVSFAEHLRNVEGVTEFSVFSLSPVTLSLRAYYHVEVSSGDAAPAQPPAAPSGSDTPPPLPADAPAMDAAPTPSMSFNALEEEASAPGSQPPPADAVPFAAAPLPPPGGAGPIETFVKDAPSDFAAPAEDATESAPVDPNVVDPTVEEVVPAATSGRRSMGFFARS